MSQSEGFEPATFRFAITAMMALPVTVSKRLVARIINALAWDIAMLGSSIICSLHILLWGTIKVNLSDV